MNEAPPPPPGRAYAPPPPPPRDARAPPLPPPLPGGARAPPGGPPPQLGGGPPPQPGGGPPPQPGGGPPPQPGGGHGRGHGRAEKKSNLMPLQGSLWQEIQRQSPPELDEAELQILFSPGAPRIAAGPSGGRGCCRGCGCPKCVLEALQRQRQTEPDPKKAALKVAYKKKVYLIDPRRAINTEIMLTKIKMSLPDMVEAVLAMDDTILSVDQVENILKFGPTKEEMETLENYAGDMENLGQCEQYFLEQMKVPRMEAKLNVFLFKIKFSYQLADFNKRLNIVNAACDEVKKSVKLKEVMKRILYLGNTLNQGAARGAAVGFKLDSLLKLTDTRASNRGMTLMHYLCRVLANKSPALLEFPDDLLSLEAATKIQLKTLSEEMLALSNGLKKVKQELDACANDGPVSAGFRTTLKQFIGLAEAEVETVTNFYVVGKNADVLAMYFGEDPSRCPFEQATQILWNIVRLFQRCHEENLERENAEREDEIEQTNNTMLELRAQNTTHNNVTINI